MAAVANNPKFAKKVGVPKTVGEEFMDADKGKKFRRGGTTNPMRAGINKTKTRAGMLQMPNASLKKFRGFKEGGDMKHSDMSKDKPMMKKVAAEAVKGHEKRMHKMAAGGVTRADGCVSKGHTKGKMVKMAYGGKC